MNPRRSRAVPASPAPRVRRASLAQAALAGVGMLAALASGGPVARADEPLWSVDASLDPTLARSLPGAEGVTGAEGVEAPPALCSFDPTVVAPAAPETAQALAPAVSLDVLAAAHPLLADRFELARVEGILAGWSSLEASIAGSPTTETARDASLCALETALASPSSAVAARARVARARCLFLVDDAAASENLEALLRRYPELPDEVSLHLEEARSLARRGRVEDAASAFRAIDLVYPGTREGRAAREGLEALAEAGHAARPLTDRERVERVTRLVRSGPPELARSELALLREATVDTRDASRSSGGSLPPLLAAEVLSLSARVSRVEGRFDEADAFAAQARALDPRQAAAPVETLARPPEEAVVRALRTAGLGALVDESATDAQRTRALRRVPSARLLEAVHVASRVGMGPTSSALVAEAARRPQLACAVRFEIAIVASGTASDESIAALAERCVDDAAYGLRARYVRARALERLGRDDEALAAFREVVAGDHTDTAFYAMWARQRLSAHGDASLDPGAAALMADAPSAAQREPAADAALDVGAALGSLVEAHGEAYPWLARAQELVSIGDRGAAREELHELYLAWLDARGRGPIRAGVEAVYRGATRPRTIVPATLRRMRRNLAGDDAVALAQVAEALGDVGLAIRFGGTTRLADRPRAFEELVTAAAERHELDPNLLLAVMRVESVYDPEIVSYAGAIGLLQIMPRTGRLIAHRLGLSDFRTDDLLDPATNIELAAWYLRSLLDRFEGRLPLAIAAYNGGPHNVRRWMEEHGPELPLDAFLERIPFDQTFRYVRRVLSHYAAYRAQQGLELPTLDTTLPPRATDSVAF